MTPRTAWNRWREDPLVRMYVPPIAGYLAVVLVLIAVLWLNGADMRGVGLGIAIVMVLSAARAWFAR